VGARSNPNPAQHPNNTNELAKEVHWIQHATFWSQIGLGLIGIAALWIYHGQLSEMRHTNELTQKALTQGHEDLVQTLIKMQKQIDAVNTSNDLTKSLVKGDQAAIVDLIVPTAPDRLQYIAAGIPALFGDKGKTAATNFRATASLQRVSIPSFRPKGHLKTITIAQDRLLPISEGHPIPEGAASAYFDTSDLGEDDIATFKNQSSSLRLKVTYSYGNGFGDTIHNSQCFLFVYAPTKVQGGQSYDSWEDCQMGMDIYRSYLRNSH
jgi:hypothetical protein